MTAPMDNAKAENNSTTDLGSWEDLFKMLDSRPKPNFAKLFDGGGIKRPRRREHQDVKTLRIKDMPLFGICPETDPFVLVVCSVCSMSIMPCALKHHYDKRHGGAAKFLASLQKQAPDAQNKAKPKKVATVKLDKGEKSKKMRSEVADEMVKDPKRPEKAKKAKPSPMDRPPLPEPEPTPSAALPGRPEKAKQKNGNGSRFPNEIQSGTTSPSAGAAAAAAAAAAAESANESGEAKDLPKKKQKEKKKNERKTDKVFDPNKHCGVINDLGKPCVRSLLCKVHQVALKRAVPNRSTTYDMLIRILKNHSEEEKVKSDHGLFRPKTEPCEKEGRHSQAAEGLAASAPSAKPWAAEPVAIKAEEPPIKRLKVEEEEMAEEEMDQSQFALPSHLEALIDETLRTLKDAEENDPVVAMLPVPPKVEPILKWSIEAAQLPQKDPNAPPQIVVDDVLWHSTHPKPLATNTFGCRLIGGLMSTCKKLDTLRKHLQSVWISSPPAATTTATTPCFGESYGPNGKQNGCAVAVNVKNSFSYSKYVKKPSVQSKVTPLVKKSVPSPAMKGTSVKRKRKTSAGIMAPVQNSSNASDIISGLLISNTVPIQGTASAAVPALPTGVIPVNSITGNGVPLRLFQGPLPVIASTAPNQSASFIQLNLCPK